MVKNLIKSKTKGKESKEQKALLNEDSDVKDFKDMTVAERRRIKESEHRIYIWSRVLVALSLVGIVAVSLTIGVLLYILLNTDTFTSVNVM